MSVTVEAPSLPSSLALPRVRDPEVLGLLERCAAAGAATAGLMGASLVVERYQAPLLLVGGVGHLAVASVASGRAFAAHVRTSAQPSIVGMLAALTTLALLVIATHLGAGS